MCIREGAKDWQGSDISIDAFRKISPYFKDVENVILQGWGEPLLHKNLIDAIKLVKEKGCKAGFVTSGKGLTRDYISDILNTGIDFIGFSFAGATANTHNSIRVNSAFEMLLNSIHTFNKIKTDHKLKNPKLHIVYLMLKDNISEIPAMLKLANELGIEEVFLTNLIHVTNDWQDKQRVFNCQNGDADIEQYEELMRKAEIKAHELKINLRRPSLSAQDVPVCEENPLGNLYISVDGEVSPCVYLHPPVPSPFKRIFCGNQNNIKKLSFGNIFRESFQNIWNSKRYTEFRDSFINRKRKSEQRYLHFLNMDRIKKLLKESLPQPPEHCRTCHKMLGV
ncbi:MAG: hypothetical protein C0415_02575 [Thermodesulfovibrio sp.]|nr:hypothetical protein [Thermodesulfovibrio sp.]